MRPVTCKGAALIIVVFAMMLFAVLGWTLANLQTGDFEVNLRKFDSAQALSLAEAGAQWAMNQLSQDSCGRTFNGAWGPYCGNVDSVCSASDWLSAAHNLGPGQYNLCVRNPVSGTETGDAVIEVKGYVPAQNNYRAMRHIKVQVQLGRLSNAIMTPPADPLNPQRGLFDWWLARQGHSIRVEGNIYVGRYRGDGNTNDNELGQDYKPPPPPLLPEDIVAPRNDARGFSASYASIDMLWLYNNSTAARRWPNPSTRDIDVSGAEVLVEMGGNRIRVNINNFFRSADVQNVIIRRNDISNWWEGNPGENWTVITSVSNGPGWSRASISPPVAWLNGQSIKLARRIYQNLDSNGSNQIWYTGGEVAGGTRADILIDARANNVRLTNKYLISEGDIAVRGSYQVRMRFTGSAATPRYPVWGTKFGRVISNEPLDVLLPSLSEWGRQNRRQIAGLIYSEFAEVNLNYLMPPSTGTFSFRGNLVYGYRITLDGRTTIRYRPNLVSNRGFEFSVGQLVWNEQ
jgi:hypothetical protein